MGETLLEKNPAPGAGAGPTPQSHWGENEREREKFGELLIEQIEELHRHTVRVYDIVQSKLEALIERNAREFVDEILSRDEVKTADEIVETYYSRCLSWYGQYEHENVDEYISELRELIASALSQIKENDDLRKKLVEYVADRLWIHLFG